MDKVIFLFHDVKPWVFGITTNDIAYYDRDDLSEEEKQAIRIYLEYGSEICGFLRDPPQEITLSDAATLAYLDAAITKSNLKREYRVFRGIGGNYGSEILGNIKRGLTLIKENEYTSFTFNEDIAFDYAIASGPDSILFVADCVIGEIALFIGGEESEIIFPRFQKWQIIQAFETRDTATKTTFIYLKRIITRNR